MIIGSARTSTLDRVAGLGAQLRDLRAPSAAPSPARSRRSSG
jgi:hypothetical protein